MRQGEGGIDIFRMEDGGIICNTSISLLQKCVLLTDFEWVFITDIRTMVDGGWWLEFVDAAKKIHFLISNNFHIPAVSSRRASPSC